MPASCSVRDKNLQASRGATFYLFKNFFYLGLLKPKKWKPLYYLYAVVMNLIVCFLLPILFILSYFFENSKMTTSQLLTSLQVAINVCGLPPKFITIFASLKRQNQAMDLMDILDSRCQRPEEREKISHCVIIGNRFTLFYLILYAFYSGSTFLTSVISGQPPYSVFMPIMDWRNSKAEFATQSLIDFALMNFVILHQAGYDVYGAIYFYVLRTHMKILVERVRSLGTDNEFSNDEHYQDLVECIKDHKNWLSLLDTISPIISITMFIQLSITAAILCTTLINILIFGDTSAQIASGIYFYAVFVQTAPCCYQATYLLYDAEQLSLAILHCEWINRDIRFRKMMIFFMMRSQKPINLMAMKLFPINLSTSLSIAKFSFSLYTLIEKMDIGQKFKH